METKTLIWIGLGIGSIVGGLLGAMLDHGNVFGAWSIILSTLGSFAGIYAGYKIGSSI